ncbi:Armadillo-type fold protein [Cordyceps fumosorosea ARSEF 2679]|uniref:Armadillo-type fold protein n=1 Tax=Cordyceps fumosorosea (strain ARSEF 2679) TaxID=1081104 RepID=A0A167S853_CORFA|nr:Armadillo-type fold protein [Cordyceps fumosorosea ARSEF 2679]OAA59356.1 Armadillo-type fold protein [Cordyceps fumosorosea ARSEF 2679]
MPSRASTTRSARPSSARPSSAGGRKRSNSALGGRVPSISRASPAPAAEFVDTPDNDLRLKISPIFRDAQRNTATHRKLAVTLRKIHEACCYETPDQKTTTDSDFDEKAFNTEFIRCALKIMPVKKTEGVGEKSIRFIGFYLRHSNEKDNELLGDMVDDASHMPETPSARLISELVEAVSPLLLAKDKFVRYRSTQLLSQIVNSLDALDDSLFQSLRHALLKKIRDKEAMVRVQAVLGLGRLAGNQSDGLTNSDDSDADQESGLLEKLLQVLQNDPSADVRRSLLVNLPILPNTLPYLLERARDQDAATRRAVYSRLLPALGDFRHLSLSMREKLLRWGLRDRDENVRKAAGRLFRDRWIEDCAGTAQQENPVPSFDGLLELLERVDVINSGVENGVALEAMSGFWEGRPDYRQAINFDDAFWETLTAESAFLARSFNDFCRKEGNGKFESLVEEKLPEVTKVAYFLERYLNALIETLRRVEQDEAEEEDETAIVEQEFIAEQLLHIALSLDYSDEVGRRKMFTLLRQALSIPELPDEVTKLTTETLHYICSPDAAGEREFCSIVLESVADVHDTIVDDLPVDDVDDSFHSARSEVSSVSASSGSKGRGKELSEEDARAKAVKEIVINMKCLHIVQCMLSHISGNLKDNTDLVAMLNNLVVPAVRSHEAPVRERGLVCLGLCALQDRSLAEENLSLFIHFFSKGHAALQVTSLHILTDILNVHGAHLFSSTPALLKVYVKAVKSGSRAPEVQAAAVMAVSKLLLGRVVSDEEACQELLKSLVVAYFDPNSAGNQTVRQALNYFLPVFCYSRATNQELMRSIALPALHTLLNVREGLENDDEADVEEDMVSMPAIGACLVDWTDPRKVYSPTSLLETEKKSINGDVHLELALDIVDRLHSNVTKEEKKLVAGLLGKLCISSGSSEDKLRETYEEVCIAVEEGVVTDAPSKNALYKIHVSLGKIVNALDEQQPQRNSRSASVLSEQQPSDGKAASEEPVIKEEDEDSDDTVIAKTSRITLSHAPASDDEMEE